MVDTKGRKLGGFLLTKLLGQGAMGAVYRGKQLSLDRDVAIKVILPTYADNPDYIKRFEREAKLIAQLTHQNITQIYEFGTFDGYYLIVMEFVEGTSLKNLLAMQKKLPIANVCEILVQIASGLSAGASKNIVHRDIKPENIQISKQGVCKILDFGLAKDDSGNAGMTMAGGILGTPSFMSPEQCQGKPVDYRADTYGLGTSAYYLLTGEVPYKADSQLAVLNMHCNAPIPDPRVLRPDVPEDLALYVMKLMSKKPEDRCKNAGQVVKELEEILHKMKDRATLAEAAQSWDWDKMIVLPTSDGTSLLDNYGGRNSNDQTIASGTFAGRTAQQSSFNQETIVSGSSTGMQTRAETMAQTQQFGQTMLPGGTVSNGTKMDATLLPSSGGGMTQTMEGTQSATIMDQRKSNKGVFIAVAALVLGVIGYFAFSGSEKDWSDIDKQIANIRSQIDKDDYAGLDLAKTILEKNSGYPKKNLVVEEIKLWEKNKQAYTDYTKIISATEEGKYKEAEALADEYKNKFSDTKYWNMILKEKKNWKDYAVASEKVEKALNLAKEFKYDESLDVLYDVQHRYANYDVERVKKLIKEFEFQNSQKKRGGLKEEVSRVKALVKADQFSQAANIIKEVMVKGNDEEKNSIKEDFEKVVVNFKSIIDKSLKENVIPADAEEVKFIQEYCKKSQEEWLNGYQQRVNSLIAEYNKLKAQANEAFDKKNYDAALTTIENARKIHKPAEDETSYLDFLVKLYGAKGDAFLEAGNYNEAYKAYKSGLKIKADDKLEKKLAEADNKLKESQKSADTDKEFNEAIKKGDKFFEEKKYQDALISYKGALALRPNDKVAEEKTRVSAFYTDSTQIEKLFSVKEDNTDLIKSNLEDLKKIAVSAEEKKVQSDLQVKLTAKKSSILKSQIEKAVDQKSFKEAGVYLKEYKSIQVAEDTNLIKTNELFKNEALKASDEMVKKSLFAQAYQLLEVIQDAVPEANVQEKMAKIKKSRDEEKARLENVEKLNSLISEAKVAYEKGQFSRALEVIEKAYAIDSKNVDVLNVRKNAGFEYFAGVGKKAEVDSKFEEAITNYKKALEYDSERPVVKATLEKLERPKAELIMIDTTSKASLQQRAWAASLGLPIEKKVIISNVEFDFVLIPPGKFKMGTEEGGDNDERPARVITISKPFYLLKSEVTNEQYRVFNANEQSYSNEAKEPVLGIVYTKVLSFCKFLGSDAGIEGNVRVPTEAEWEYACRSGNTGDYCFGDKLPELSEYGFFKDNSGNIKKVMQLKPNSFGLYDMHGNAYEWCRDFYEKDAYSKTKDVDPFYGAEEDQKGKTKVIRGGDCLSTPANLKSANRNSLAFAQRELLKTVGFRVMIEVNPK